MSGKNGSIVVDEDDDEPTVQIAAKVSGRGNRSSERNAHGQFVPVAQSATEVALLKHLETLYKNLNLTLDAHTRSTAELLKLQREALATANADNRKLHKLLLAAREPQAESEESEEALAIRRAGLQKLMEWGPRVLAAVEKHLDNNSEGNSDDT